MINSKNMKTYYPSLRCVASLRTSASLPRMLCFLRSSNAPYAFSKSLTVDSLNFKIFPASLIRVKHIHSITNDNLTNNNLTSDNLTNDNLTNDNLTNDLTNDNLTNDLTNEDLMNDLTNDYSINGLYEPLNKDDLTKNDIHLLACFSGFDLNFDNDVLTLIEHKLDDYLSSGDYNPEATDTFQETNIKQNKNQFLINIKTLHVEEKMIEKFLSLIEDLDADYYPY